MSSQPDAPVPSPDGSTAPEQPATDPGWTAARDRLAAALAATSLPTYGGSAHLHHAARRHHRS
ncbi:hypothetical protein [Saccharothrix sp.]|uniref:hypothetical protein n=1 Tax=Saccharothrix sp. TaxID=1873460 RepID=UPI00281144BB|nr:hypothetical protein [Saccharothrix sp.]